MSYLPIILVVVFLLFKSGNKNLLNGFDFESISPLLSLFGIPEQAIEVLKGEELKNLLNGNVDIKSVLPLITGLMSSMQSVKTNEPSPTSDTQQPEYLSPIKDVASSEILSSLNNFFN